MDLGNLKRLLMQHFGIYI